MPKKAAIGKLAIDGFDSIFKSTVDCANTDDPCAQITEIPLGELYPPDFHPFQVNDDEAMDRLAANIKQHGVREPGMVRPRLDNNGKPVGGYEVLAGNRRKRACEIAGLSAMPAIIREMDDDDAVLALVDSNLEHRERLLPSERAWAYRIKMEALSHKGVKDGKLSAETVAEQNGGSRSQVFRVIRLTELIVGLLDKVDAGKLAFNPAVELSYLSQTEQSEVVSAMEQYEVKPSLSQAVKLKKLKQGGKLTKESIHGIFSETNHKTVREDREVISFRKYFPVDYSAKQIKKVIIDLLAAWKADFAQ